MRHVKRLCLHLPAHRYDASMPALLSCKWAVTQQHSFTLCCRLSPFKGCFEATGNAPRMTSGGSDCTHPTIHPDTILRFVASTFVLEFGPVYCYRYRPVAGGSIERYRQNCGTNQLSVGTCSLPFVRSVQITVHVYAGTYSPACKQYRQNLPLQLLGERGLSKLRLLKQIKLWQRVVRFSKTLAIPVGQVETPPTVARRPKNLATEMDAQKATTQRTMPRSGKGFCKRQGHVVTTTALFVFANCTERRMKVWRMRARRLIVVTMATEVEAVEWCC